MFWPVAATEAEREAGGESDFLRPENDAGEIADFHSFRHSYVSRLVRSGVDPKAAQRLAGHSTAELTLSRYTHADVADRAKALKRMPSLLFGPSGGPELAPNMSALALPGPSERVPNGLNMGLEGGESDLANSLEKGGFVAFWQHRATTIGGGGRIRTRERCRHP